MLRDDEAGMAVYVVHDTVAPCLDHMDGVSGLSRIAVRLGRFGGLGRFRGLMCRLRWRSRSELLTRIFNNSMEYDLEQLEGYYRLRERLTQSVVRLQTSSKLLRESFWNYYHGLPSSTWS